MTITALLSLALLVNVVLSLRLWRAYQVLLWQREYTLRAVERMAAPFGSDD